MALLIPHDTCRERRNVRHTCSIMIVHKWPFFKIPPSLHGFVWKGIFSKGTLLASLLWCIRNFPLTQVCSNISYVSLMIFILIAVQFHRYYLKVVNFDSLSASNCFVFCSIYCSCNLPLEERRESDNRRDDIVQLKDTLLSMPGGTPEYLQTFACLNQLLAKESIPLIVAVGGDILRIFRKLKATAGAIPEENMDGTSRPFGEHKEDGTPSCEVCRSKESLLRCGRCKSVYYCGRLHQRKHWKKHKAVCKANESA